MQLMTAATPTVRWGPVPIWCVVHQVLIMAPAHHLCWVLILHAHQVVWESQQPAFLVVVAVDIVLLVLGDVVPVGVGWDGERVLLLTCILVHDGGLHDLAVPLVSDYGLACSEWVLRKLSVVLLIALRPCYLAGLHSLVLLLGAFVHFGRVEELVLGRNSVRIIVVKDGLRVHLVGIVLKCVTVLRAGDELLAIIGRHLLLGNVLDCELLGKIWHFLALVVVEEVCLSLHFSSID